MTCLLSIAPIVEAAAAAAGSSAQQFAVPFPGCGQQGRFREEMTRILPLLPTSP
jgi:hypothetical protein